MFYLKHPDITKTKVSTGMTVCITKDENNELYFPLSPLVSSKSIKDMNEDMHYHVLNVYLNAMGEEFKLKLWNTLCDINRKITILIESTFNPPLSPDYITPIIDLFNIDDVTVYLRDVYQIEVPSNIKSAWTEEMAGYGRDDEEQTYLVSDYYRLMALTMVSQVVLLPFTTVTFYMKKELSSTLVEYVYLQTIKRTSLYKDPAMDKLFKLIKKTIERTDNDTKQGPDPRVRIVEKGLPLEEIPYYVLGTALFQRVFAYSIPPKGTLNNGKSLVHNIYNYTTTKIQVSSDVARAFKQKNPLTDADSPAGEDESIIESHRATFNLEQGTIVEYIWGFKTPQAVLNLGIVVDEVVLNDIPSIMSMKDNIKMTKLHNAILSIIYKRYIDPRIIDYLPKDTLINLLVIAFAYLIKHKNQLASYMISSIQENFKISPKSNIRLPQYIKDELYAKYPYSQLQMNQSKVKKKPFVDELIDNVYRLTQEYNFIPLIDLSRYTLEEKDIRHSIVDLILVA